MEKITAAVSRERIAPGIYRYTSKLPKIGWMQDKRSGFYCCYAIDVMLSAGKDSSGKGFRKRHRAKPFASRLDAELVLAKLKLQGHEENYQIDLIEKTETTLEEAFAAVIPLMKSAAERKRAHRLCPIFLETLPPSYLVRQLEEEDTRAFADRRRRDGLSEGTIYRDVNTISAVAHLIPKHFKRLKKWQCPPFHRPPAAAGRERVYSTDEIERLFERLFDENILPGEKPLEFVARRRAGLIMRFALMTAARHGDVCRIRKVWYDRRAGRLQIWHSKTKKFTVYQPVTETVGWLLDEGEKLHPAGDYFFSAHGKIHAKIYSTLERICADLSIPYGRGVENGITIHDLRHTATTALLHSGVDAKTTQTIRGDSRVEMQNHYSHATTGSRFEAMQVLEAKFGIGCENKNDGEQLKNFAVELYRMIKTDEISEQEFAEKLAEITASVTNEISANR